MKDFPTARDVARDPVSTKWPFMFVVDTRGRSTNWVLLHAPIQSTERMDLFTDLRKRGFGFVGMTSFSEFPAESESSPLDYAAVCQGWAHCFREPARYLPDGQPHALLSLSDFTDPARISPHRYPPPDDAADRFDFVYVGPNREWKMAAKNWPLAARCLPRLCGDLGLRGLVVGMDPAGAPKLPGLEIRPWLPHDAWLRLLAGSRFLFVPNAQDASPRVMAEALCLNVPLLVNRALLGGWKYVANTTGLFFSSDEDVAYHADQLLGHAYRPRAWFLSQFGPRRAGRRLWALINQIDPALTATAPLALSYRLSPPPISTVPAGPG